METVTGTQIAAGFAIETSVKMSLPASRSPTYLPQLRLALIPALREMTVVGDASFAKCSESGKSSSAADVAGGEGVPP